MAMAASETRPEAVPSERAPGRLEAARRPWTRLNRFLQHWAGVAVYLALLSAWIVARGLPVSRAGVALWLIAGTLAFSFRDLPHWIESVALEWFPFVAFLFLYDIARTFADNLRPTNIGAAIDGDRLLFAGHVPTIWLQEHLWHGVKDIRWYDYAAWGVYMTYFFGTLLVAAALWVFAYHRFRRYVAAVSLLTIAGFVTYVVFPAAPPWYASSHGALGASDRLTGLVWSDALPSFSRVVQHGQAFSNPVAAIPSLHAGFTLLIMLSLWKSARWWGRIPLAAYPLLMGFTLVYFAEHYVVDILAGWVYALGAYAAVQWYAARRARRRSTVTPRPASARGALPVPVPEEPS
jgi:membrane-associated phospholipid phosphatase